MRSSDWALLHSSPGEEADEYFSEMRRRLERNAHDREARLILLGAMWATNTVEVRAAVCWFIEHEPKTFLGQYALLAEESAFQRGKALWLAKVEEAPTDADIVENAAWFLSVRDPQSGADLIAGTAERLGTADSFARVAVYLDFIIALLPAEMQPVFVPRALEAAFRAFAVADDDPSPLLGLLPLMVERARPTADAYRLLNAAERARGEWRAARIAAPSHVVQAIAGLVALAACDESGAEKRFQAAMLAESIPENVVIELADGLVTRGRRDAVLSAIERWSERHPENAGDLLIWSEGIRSHLPVKPPRLVRR